MSALRWLLALIFAATSLAAMAADYPAPKHGDFVIPNFKFHTGETIKELKLHYATIGDPAGLPVLVLLTMPGGLDANDFIYQWQASHDYDATAGLSRIEATLLAINAADDERNSPETGVTQAAIQKLKHGSLYLIPASVETRGHATTGNAKFFK